jgi:hypothetical protein
MHTTKLVTNELLTSLQIQYHTTEAICGPAAQERGSAGQLRTAAVNSPGRPCDPACPDALHAHCTLKKLWKKRAMLWDLAGGSATGGGAAWGICGSAGGGAPQLPANGFAAMTDAKWQGRRSG